MPGPFFLSSCPVLVPIKTPHPLRSPAFAWGVLVLAALGFVGFVVFRVAVNHLRSEALAAATQWADLVLRLVPEAADACEGGALPAQAQTRLQTLGRGGTVFRYELIDAGGRVLAGSDRSPQVLAGAALPAGRVPARLGPMPEVAVAQGDGVALPAIHGDAQLPLQREGRVIGQLRVGVDLSAAAARVQASALTVGMAGGGALLVLAGAGWWRVRQLRRMDAHARYLAQHDLLTGALHRTSFRQALKHALWNSRNGGPGFAVMCIDLDRFKQVNDTLGHPVGDEMLREVVRRLQTAGRSGDMVARLGGDEFALLQLGVTSSDDVAALARRIVAALGEPYELLGHQVRAGASVGAAIFGIDGEQIDELLHRADLALYRAKNDGGSGFSFYDAALDDRLQRRRVLTQELREAIDAERMALHYQPLFDTDGLTVKGYEALMRWPHPTRGTVSPGEFIPLAEETGLIDPLGRWALREACRQAMTWPDTLTVAVNLSVAQFRHGEGLVDDVRRALAESGLPPSRLELEITESLLIANTEQALSVLGDLHALGVRIAMDDFGTGYSSLSYLWRFPFDKVKIDRSFTQHLADDAKVRLIVQSIVTMAHGLHIRVNAEGVETQAQLQALRAQGCDELQGFLLGRPAPPDTLNHQEARAAKAPALEAPHRHEASVSAEAPAASDSELERVA